MNRRKRIYICITSGAVASGADLTDCLMLLEEKPIQLLFSKTADTPKITRNSITGIWEAIDEVGTDSRAIVETGAVYFVSNDIHAYLGTSLGLSGNYSIKFDAINIYTVQRFIVSYSAAGIEHGLMTDASNKWHLSLSTTTKHDLGAYIATDGAKHTYELKRDGLLTKFIVDDVEVSSQALGYYNITINMIGGRNNVTSQITDRSSCILHDMVFTTEVASESTRFHMEETKGNSLIDASGNLNHATLYDYAASNRVTNNRFRSFWNEYGGNIDPTNGYVPLVIGTENDAGGTPAVYTGRVKYNARIINSTMGNFNGARYVDIPSDTFGDTGTETEFNFEIDMRTVATGYCLGLTEGLTAPDAVYMYTATTYVGVNIFVDSSLTLAFQVNLDTTVFHKYRFEMTTSGTKFYVDGVEVTPTYSTGNSSTYIDISTLTIDNVRLGGLWYNSSEYYHNGNISFFNWNDRIEYRFVEDAGIYLFDYYGLISAVVTGSLTGFWVKDLVGRVKPRKHNGWDLWKIDATSEEVVAVYNDDREPAFVPPIAGFTLISQHPNPDPKLVTGYSIYNYPSYQMAIADDNYWFSSFDTPYARPTSELLKSHLDKRFTNITEATERYSQLASYAVTQVDPALTRILDCISLIWILNEGVWNDDGDWRDDAVWQD